MIKARTDLKSAQKLKRLTGAGAAIVLSFVAAGGEILSYPSPMNVIIAALSGRNAVFALAGSALSYIIGGSLIDGVANLCTIATLIAVRMILGKFEEPIAVAALLPSSILLLYSAIISLVRESELTAVLYSILSTLICFSVIFSARACAEKYQSDGIIDLSGTAGIMTAVLFVAAVMTLANASLLGINLGRTLGVAVILFSAGKYKHIGGAVYGALAAFGVIICSTDMAKNTLLLAVAGLLCGAFANIGTAAQIISFAAAVLGGIFITGTNGDSFKLLADVTVGTVAYLCVPDNRLLSAFRMIGGRKKSPEISCHTAASKLDFASESILSVKEQIETVTSALEKKTEPCELSVKVRACVCRDCSMLSKCWDTDRKQTVSAFSSLGLRANANGAVTSQDIRLKLPDCCRKTLLCNSFNMLYMTVQYEKGRSERMKELRELLCSQLGVMSKMFDDLAGDTKRLSRIDVLLSDTIADIVYKHGIKNAKICAFIDPDNQPTVEMYIPKSAKPDMVKLTVDISEAACVDFDMPVISMTDDLKRLEFSALPYYSIEYDALSASAVFGDYSGDYYEMLRPSPNRQYVILSDGMGTGKRARLDSMFTVNLVTRLLTSGIAASTSATLINSILRVKSWEESFATLDIAEINLATGSLNLLKCGAAESYLLRKGRLNALDAKTFPLGILSSASPGTISVTLEREDILLLCSDGVARSVIERALDCKKSLNKRSPQEIVHFITDEINSRQSVSKPDDVTAIAIKIV